MDGALWYKHNFFGRDMPTKMKRRYIASNEKTYWLLEARADLSQKKASKLNIDQKSWPCQYIFVISYL